MDFRIAGIVEESVVDGPGIRFTVFTQGCCHHCRGCHNPQTHDEKAGILTTTEEVIEQLKNCYRKGIITGLSISGGEPFMQADACRELATVAHQLGLDVTVWTGWTVEEIFEHPEWVDFIGEIDTIIDGRFIESQRNLELRWRGSENQRVIKLSKKGFLDNSY